MTGQWSYKLEYRDFNGDGFVDVVRYRTYPSCNGCYTIGDSSTISVALNTNGTGFTAFQPWLTVGTNWRKMVRLGDFNGDRLPDLVGYDGTVAINTGSGFTFDSAWPAISGLQSNLANTSEASDIGIGDFNGDGLSDVIGFYSSGIKVYLSQGLGFEAGQLWSTVVATKNTHRYLLSDINADRRTDIFFQ